MPRVCPVQNPSKLTYRQQSLLDKFGETSGSGIDFGILTSSISVPTQSWESLLPTRLKSEYDSFETSFISGIQHVEASVLSVTPGMPIPTVTSSSSTSSNSSSVEPTVQSAGNSTATSSSTASSLGGASTTALSSAAGSSSSSASGAGPTNMAWNAGLGAAVGAVGIAAVLL